MTLPKATEWNENAASSTRIAYAGTDLQELVATELDTFNITFNKNLQLPSKNTWASNQSSHCPKLFYWKLMKKANALNSYRTVEKRIFYSMA